MPEPFLIRRSGERFVTERDGIRTLHSFSYGDHYDPDNVGFGPIVAINEEHVPPGAGYPAHRHADVEIVTWVLEGVLAHQDSTGRGGLVHPGTAQRLSAGSGAEHSERNASDDHPLRFVQMMLRPSRASLLAGAPPTYDRLDVGTGLSRAVSVGADAELWVARPRGASLVVSAAPRVLVHATRGLVHVAGEELEAGDELRSEGGSTLVLEGDGEALVWRLDIVGH